MTLNEIKHKFSISKPYTQLIYINIAVFIIVAIVNIVVTLGSFRSVGFSDVLQLSSDFSLFYKTFLDDNIVYVRAYKPITSIFQYDMLILVRAIVLNVVYG